MPDPLNIRIGQGFDVHAFGDGDHVMLGGVRVPHTRGVLEATVEAMVALDQLDEGRAFTLDIQGVPASVWGVGYRFGVEP